MHPSYDFVFLFDHSAGHAKQRPDGLNHHRMNSSLRRQECMPLMRDTIMIQEEGYLGPFPRILEPGDTQCPLSSLHLGLRSVLDVKRRKGRECRYDKNLGRYQELSISRYARIDPTAGERRIGDDVRDTLTGKSIRQLRSPLFATWTCDLQGLVPNSG